MKKHEEEMFLQRIEELETIKDRLGVMTTSEATMLAVNLECWIDQLIANIQSAIKEAACR